VLSEVDKERARYHLGYMTVVIPGSMAFSIPQVTETQWLFEDAVTRIRVESEQRVIGLLDKLDQIECTLFRASSELFAKRAAELEPNLSQPDDVEREYMRWACRLADMLGVFPYPYSERFKALVNNGGRAGNVAVRR
jgi:hypothetical protein